MKHIDLTTVRGKKQSPSGKGLHSYGKSPSLVGKSTNSMGHFQYVKITRGDRLWSFVTVCHGVDGPFTSIIVKN